MAAPAAALAPLALQAAERVSVKAGGAIWAALRQPLIEGGGNKTVRTKVSRNGRDVTSSERTSPKWSVPAWLPAFGAALGTVEYVAQQLAASQASGGLSGLGLSLNPISNAEWILTFGPARTVLGLIMGNIKLPSGL